MQLINQEQVKVNENMSDEEILTVGNDYWMQLAHDLEGLKQDERFQRVILEGYFKDRPINGVFMLDAPGVAENGARKDLMEEMISISKLQWYFKMIESMGSAPEETEE